MVLSLQISYDIYYAIICLWRRWSAGPPTGRGEQRQTRSVTHVVGRGVRSCDVCKRTKAKHVTPCGLLYPLPLPTRRGGCVIWGRQAGGPPSRVPTGSCVGPLQPGAGAGRPPLWQGPCCSCLRTDTAADAMRPRSSLRWHFAQ